MSDPWRVQAAREWKATKIEQTLVEMGLREVPTDSVLRKEVLEKAGYDGASEKTWRMVAVFLSHRIWAPQ